MTGGWLLCGVDMQTDKSIHQDQLDDIAKMIGKSVDERLEQGLQRIGNIPVTNSEELVRQLEKLVFEYVQALLPLMLKQVSNLLEKMPKEKDVWETEDEDAQKMPNLPIKCRILQSVHDTISDALAHVALDEQKSHLGTTLHQRIKTMAKAAIPNTGVSQQILDLPGEDSSPPKPLPDVPVAEVDAPKLDEGPFAQDRPDGQPSSVQVLRVTSPSPIDQPIEEVGMGTDNTQDLCQPFEVEAGSNEPTGQVASSEMKRSSSILSRRGTVVKEAWGDEITATSNNVRFQDASSNAVRSDDSVPERRAPALTES